MTISEIYSQYKIMPSLQLHQLRVAAVATQMAESAYEQLNINAITTATLLHDMGNIIKFKLDLFPEFLQPEGLEYWREVKQEFINKYGDDEHNATYDIAEEIGIDKESMQLLKSIGFSKAPEVLKRNDISQMIVCYADHRVGPKSVLSLEDRMQEGQKRFKKNKNVADKDIEKHEESFRTLSAAMIEIEQCLFKMLVLQPQMITDESIASTVEGLKRFEINASS